MTETCSTCRFWTGASCRRFPPIVTAVADAYQPKWPITQTNWPKTEAGEWCGEWKTRKVTP